MRWYGQLANSFGLFLRFQPFTAVDGDYDPSLKPWNLFEKPDLNDTTSNLIFSTADSLLQHWPNTRYRNGHTIVPATIPTGTLLYFGTPEPEIPKDPDWLAMDPELSYMFCGVPAPFPSSNSSLAEPNDAPKNGGWHLTFAATRPLKLLYFDGSSAAKLLDGSLDSQDLITWGGVREDLVNEERERIETLCSWGKNYDLDGFVRMEMAFEVMFCNFTAGLDLVTSLNLPSAPPLPSRPGGALPLPAMRSMRSHVLEAGSWSHHFPGDDRIKVDYSRMISFYDKELFPDLHLQRVGQERWGHRLNGTTDAEVKGLLARLDKVLTTKEREGGIDWKAFFHVVTSRYADRLELLQYQLEDAASFSKADQETALWKVHRFVSAMLMPYIPRDSLPSTSFIRNHRNWAAPVFKYCATTHTQYLISSVPLTEAETLLLNAVREVSREICRVLVAIWAEGKELSSALGGGDIRRYDPETRLLRWKTSVSDLTTWLDWNVWVRCRPECPYEERCYLPTWPYLDFDQPLENESAPTDGKEPNWKRPQPVCIRRLEPYNL